ncbi:MAG: threonine synthase [Spirochaetes bacterium]|nr:threonine synthase [Spirochaetota bacterium]
MRCDTLHATTDFSKGGEVYTCPACGGNLQVVYDYDEVKRAVKNGLRGGPETGIWRYMPFLPVEKSCRKPPLEIGRTPLYRAHTLASRLGLPSLYVKDDGRNPSCSSKDRASAVVLARAADTAFDTICCASTGNAASSLACLAAPLGVKTVIFVPENAPQAKLVQLFVYGSTVFAVKGDYDDAYDLAVSAAEEFGWYNRNTGYNPFTREGKKTVSFEICEQLAVEKKKKKPFFAPDAVFVPVGDGNLISGIYKGFSDLFETGLIPRVPRLYGCQASGSDSVTKAFQTDGVLRPSEGRSIADSIAVRLPRDGDAAVAALKGSKGDSIAVGDDTILAAAIDLARCTGVFAEPAGAAPLACLKEAVERDMVGPSDSVVLLASGNGLKDVDAAKKATGEPAVIEPTIEDLKRHLRS